MSDRMLSMFREVVERARELCPTPDSAPAVQHTLMEHFLDRLTMQPLHGYVLVNGANPLIRKVFKAIYDGQGAEARQRQLADWPTTEMRNLVAKINNAAIFVPSRGEFVELVPDALTADETREAGQYLIGQGQDTIQRGRLLLRLAKLRDKDGGS